MADTKESELRPITIEQVKARAKAKLAKQVWDYYVDGADAQKTLARNSDAFDELILRPRVLRDVSDVDTSTTILGKHYNIPIGVAPSAYQKLVGDGGEIDNFRATQKIGTNFILSSNATTSMEDVIQSVPSSSGASNYPKPWFQLYFLRSRDVTEQLIARAEKAGYEALVLTVDTPVMGNRVHERHHPLQLPPHISRANLNIKGGGASKSRLLLNARTAAEAKLVQEEWREWLTDSSLVWHEAILWLRARTKLAIIVKGIMTAEDAELAVAAGVDAVIISNHGGRQLDGVSSTLEALPEIVDAVKGKIPVILDGGISHGSDVFKALALGADLCLIGRTALWGLAYDGQQGVEDVLNILERELWRTMSLMGAASIKEITRSMLGRRKTTGFGIVKL